MLYDRTLLNHDSRYIYIQLTSFNKACRALSKLGKPRMALNDEQLMAIQHIYMARTCFVWLLTDTASTNMSCYCLYSCSQPLWKGRSGISPLQTCKLRFYTVYLHIEIVYFTEYFSISLSANSAYIS